LKEGIFVYNNGVFDEGFHFN
jgi:hypothetical protein